MCFTAERRRARIRPMATPERLPTSRRLQSAALAERERLSRELERLDRRAAALNAELTKLDSHRQELREQLALLARLAHSEADSPFPTRRLRPVAADDEANVRADESMAQEAPLGVLRGARIREVAVLLLASSATPTRSIHYSKWYELVRGAGYGVAGREPVAAFLTQISRSPVVAKAGGPGVYALDLDAPVELRRRIGRLRAEILQLSSSDETTAEGVAATRQRRSELSRALAEAERRLEEALRSLGQGEANE